jgi:ubiquitin-conjugating enzyme E2 Q
MRYLLRCTEFCLVCHDKIEGGFEALKPYVCSKPLCLYQYMSLGFGPSVEHEILTQPYVVDLLVSFCYTAALNQRLREYPTGMSLHVPPVTTSVTHVSGSRFGYQYPPPVAAAVAVPVVASTETTTEVKYDIGRQEIIFAETVATCPVHNGDWIAMILTGM